MTSSIKWEPLEDLKAIRGLCSRVLGRGQRRFPGKLVDDRLFVDLYETNDAFVAEADAPGIEAEDLDVSVLGYELTIGVERKAAEGREYLYSERPAGKFWRKLTLPTEIDVEKIQARLQDGVLVLTMPKREQARGVTISVAPKTRRATPKS